MAADTAPSLNPVASLRKHLPTRKLSTKEFEMIKPPSPTSPVVISVVEARPSTSDSSCKSSMESKYSERRPRRPTITIPKKAHVGPESPRTEVHPLPESLPTPRRRTPADIPLPQSAIDNQYPPRSDSRATSRATTAVPSEQTPVMRSMFPSYNPDVSLGQQQYYPNPDVVPTLVRMNEFGQSSSVHIPQGDSKEHLAPITTDRDKKESPLRRSDSLKRPNGYSKPEELSDLWSIANGQTVEEAADSYVFELSCDDLALDAEIITFSTTRGPLYALSASKGNQISAMRIHPTDHRTKIPICSTVLNQPSRQDPLIASIFPKLAGLLALDQSSTAAIGRRLDRQASALLQAEAIRQSQEREASMLLWDCDSGRFCLLHPSLLDGTATTMRIEIVPNTINPERITIFAPETGTPLVELEMRTLSLQIHTNPIRALPSLYLLDTLVIALLTLLLHLHRLCANPSIRHSPPQPEESSIYFPPPPPSLHSNASKRDLRRQRAESRHSTFRSIRSVKSSRSLTSTVAADGNDKDIELGNLDPQTGHAKEEEGFKIEKKKAPKGIIDCDDPGLPKGTRAALRFLYWIFQVVYWIMGALFQLFALAVVGLGKFVTKL